MLYVGKNLHQKDDWKYNNPASNVHHLEAFIWFYKEVTSLNTTFTGQNSLTGRAKWKWPSPSNPASQQAKKQTSSIPFRGLVPLANPGAAGIPILKLHRGRCACCTSCINGYIYAATTTRSVLVLRFGTHSHHREDKPFIVKDTMVDFNTCIRFHEKIFCTFRSSAHNHHL
jgi:hypothetical protein